MIKSDAIIASLVNRLITTGVAQKMNKKQARQFFSTYRSKVRPKIDAIRNCRNENNHFVMVAQ
jgi:hypothetical protein